MSPRATRPLVDDPAASSAATPYRQLHSKDHHSREFVCGWGAASVNIMLTFPINKVMFRQQLYAITAQHALGQLRKEGLIHLYRGMLPPLLMKTTSMSIMFGMYDEFQHALHVCTPNLPTKVNKGTAAVLSGFAEAILTPFERVQVLLQDKYKHKLYRNTAHAFSELRPHGVSEYYRGVSACLVRNGPSNAIFFLLREELKHSMPKASTRAGDIFADFVSGAILGAMISTMFFPVNVVKNQMQCVVGGPHLSMNQAFWVVFNDRGRSWRAMFRGVPVNYTRSLLSWGVINASYEILKRQLYPEDDIL
ncbi:hypothetical protein CAPTEDRAFT_128352 [Capitella teleta]|uniref:Solute carrier family 25 member 51 n=1 Tax=Capitella teleta TaxID=283909 RepID=R7UUM4_CAPTE|nr:hypothetical protein CAPTEDRAFT_128352 [Capitella teleta]|eukprot:ELU09895.1 hypothetical protein CAPTEDRAFT_128352 [Capitella teleta]